MGLTDWITLATDTTPVDRYMVEKGIADCYVTAGLDPVPCVWVDGPEDLAAHVAAADPDLDESMALRVSSRVGIALDADTIDPDMTTGRRVTAAVAGRELVAQRAVKTFHPYWYRYLAGQYGLGWLASIEHAVGAQPVFVAYRDANSAGWWWPHRDWVVVCDRFDSAPP